MASSAQASPITNNAAQVANGPTPGRKRGRPYSHHQRNYMKAIFNAGERIITETRGAEIGASIGLSGYTVRRYFQELRRTPRTNKGRLEAAQAAATAAPTGSATVASQRQAPKNATITAKKTASLGGSTLNTTHVPKGLEKIDPRLWFEGL